MRQKTAARMLFTFLILLPSSALWAGGTKEAVLESGSFFALGTTCTVSIYGGTDEQFFDTERLITDIENRMSVNIPDSEISAVNDAAGIKPVNISSQVFEVVSAGLEFSRISGGAFDISIGPLVSLWDIGGGGASVPPADLISGTLSLVDYRRVEITKTPDGGTVFLPAPGMALEPGGIAKGYAADRAASYLKDSGVKSALINFGGNVLTIGSKIDGSNWRIGIQNPDSSRGDYIGIISVADKAVVTSGKYERFFIGGDGRRYHHILSTGNGFPVENGIAQVSIISAESMTADAMSTTVFSLGLAEGLKLAEGMKDVEAIVVMENGEIYLTEGLSRNFRLTDQSFTVIE